ncbi:MAG: FxsA family protein, partial [Myxococcota bacterium]
MPPGERVLEGVMVFVGGLLLITPGVFTDIAGFLLITGPTRRLLAPPILAWLTRNIDIRVSDGRHGQPGFPPGAGFPGGMPPGAEVPPPRRRPSRPEVPAEHPTPFSNKFDDLP